MKEEKAEKERRIEEQKPEEFHGAGFVLRGEVLDGLYKPRDTYKIKQEKPKK